MRGTRTWRVAAAAAAISTLATTGAVTAATAGQAATAASSARTGAARSERAVDAAGQSSTSACPKVARGALPLRSDSVQRAAYAALASAARLYPGVHTAGAEVMAADRSAFAGVRGAEVTRLCGGRIAGRTVVVQMLFPRMLPSASLSQSVVFVSRFGHTYRVWYVAH